MILSDFISIRVVSLSEDFVLTYVLLLPCLPIACSSAYDVKHNSSEYFACTIGCNNTVTTVGADALNGHDIRPKVQSVANDDNQAIGDSINDSDADNSDQMFLSPINMFKSLFASLANRGSGPVVIERSSMSVFLSRNSDGESKIMVVQSEPEVVVHQYPDLMQQSGTISATGRPNRVALITRVKTLVHKHCRKDEGKPDISDKPLKSICINKKGHPLSDSFCNGLSGRLPMGADCDHIVDSLAKGINPYPTPSVSVRPPQHSGPNQSSTARPNPQSTAVSIQTKTNMAKKSTDANTQRGTPDSYGKQLDQLFSTCLLFTTSNGFSCVQMETSKYDSESVTGSEEHITTDNNRPKLDVSIWTQENPLDVPVLSYRGNLHHFSRHVEKSWSNCFPYESGVPRWVLASVLFLAMFVLVWICCATTTTAPEQHIRARKVGQGSDLKYLCLYEEPVKLMIDDKLPTYEELEAQKQFTESNDIINKNTTDCKE
ncbi:unnamed protein product [Medioppia subpectinata]|uniref:Uncharacterized protein n=1 Tax=Medioppia subpectinata TaxID=1979941 RepID=A0A7R9KHZ8_9ACAR|nr:unnamed protein product [Medioppia subpectinata]CAG2104040.1 unnamed protein product [Medioppia subpectinata]